MWRTKFIAVLVVVLGALVFGATVAFAGWGWNAKVNVNGTVISTAWTVTDDEDGAADYKARITITIPKEADAFVEELEKRIEKVEIVHSRDMKCTRRGIETNVSYVVTHNTGAGEPGKNVEVSVSTVEKKTP